MKIINPATEEIIKDIQEDTKETIDTKFAALQSSQPLWQEVPLTDRISIIKFFAVQLKENTESLSQVLTSEVGKPLQQARNEINGAINRITWLTNNAEKYLSDETMHMEPGLEEENLL